MVPGLLRRTLVTGNSMMVCECTFKANVHVPTHSHPHEQVGYVVSGKLRIVIDGECLSLSAIEAGTENMDEEIGNIRE